MPKLAKSRILVPSYIFSVHCQIVQFKKDSDINQNSFFFFLMNNEIFNVKQRKERKGKNIS